MRGPHNIFRLIRTGATLERTGAMNVILDAYNAPWGVRLAAKNPRMAVSMAGLQG